MSSRARASTTRYPPLSEATNAKLRVHQDLMGTIPDVAIAHLAGVDRRYVVVYRMENGIPAYDFKKSELPRPAPPVRQIKEVQFRKSRLDLYRNLMGVMSDAEAAAQALASREAVMRYRQRHGISAANKPMPVASTPASEDSLPNTVTDEAKASPFRNSPVELPYPSPSRTVAWAQSAAEGGDHAYMVTLSQGSSTREAIILADDIAQAASKSDLLRTDAPGSRVISIRWIGLVLSNAAPARP